MKLTGRMTINSILKPTKAKFFRDLVPGDILFLSVTIAKKGRGGHGGLYATYINIERTNSVGQTIKHGASMNDLMNRLENFDWEEI